jgi:fatty-acyl-CoA synthase
MDSRGGASQGNGSWPWPGRSGVSRTELDPVTFLYRSAAIHPDRVAVVDGDRRRTYAELCERVNRLAAALRAGGLRRHDRVAALCLNGGPLLELHHAVPAAGGVLVAINTRLGRDEVRHIIDHSGARMLFVDATLAALVEDRSPRLEVIGVGGPSGTDRYEQLVGSGDPAGVPSQLVDEEEPIAIDYTSGTTGRPKGVVYTYRGAYLNALGEVIEAELGHGPVYLWTLPMFHCNGWCFPWAVTAAAGTHVCLRQVDAAEIWRLFREERVTHYCGSPTVHTALVSHPDAAALKHEVTALVAAAPPSPTLLARMEALNIRVVHVYGLTETYGPHTVCARPDDWDKMQTRQRARVLSRQGQGYTTADLVRVVDERMHDVPRDAATIGEVVMRGNNVMSGYFADPDGTEDAFRGGWFHSGDLAVWHPDNAIELRDRAKDVIISGGENISSIEVEQAICAHPAVLECAVIAVPDERWGERPKAFVTLRSGASAGQDDIIAFCRERIAHYKCPDAVVFAELPKTSTGKVQKSRLREPEWAGHERGIN